MLAAAKTSAKSTVTVTPRAAFEPKFRTVLAPNANWPKGETK
jgi:hypothetical protein